MNVMIVDIGSNTIKYDIFAPDSTKSIGHRSVTAGIISYIENGVMNEEGISLLCNILCDYRKDANEKGLSFYVFATASLRRVNDPQSLIRIVKERTGIQIDLISGEDESSLSLAGMLSQNPSATKGVMMDMGGGSTELNAFENSISHYSTSCPFGALSLKNSFVSGVFPTKQEAVSIENYVYSILNNHAKHIENQTLFMVGGSAKAMAKFLCHTMESKKTLFAPSDFEDLLNLLLENKNDETTEMKNMFPDRYHVMIPALVAYVCLLKTCKASEVIVSGAGIREGYLQRICQKENHQSERTG